jgi:hypothetical protein
MTVSARRGLAVINCSRAFHSIESRILAKLPAVLIGKSLAVLFVPDMRNSCVLVVADNGQANKVAVDVRIVVSRAGAQ